MTETTPDPFSIQLTAADGTVYSYDANGNQTAVGDQTGSANRLTNDGTWTYTYDAEGDLTKKSKGTSLETWYYGYDTLNRLTSVEQTSNGTALLLTATYTYDVLGHRSEEDDWQTGGTTTVTRTIYDGDAAWADLNGSNVVQTRYMAGPGVNQWLARIDSGGDEWLLTDRLGSVRDVVGSAGTLVLDHAEYQAFGGVASDTSAASAGALGFDGEREDRNTGELFSDKRVDNTQTHQWQQEDPIQFKGGDGNLRRVVGNDSVNATDPTGLDWVGVRQRDLPFPLPPLLSPPGDNWQAILHPPILPPPLDFGPYNIDWSTPPILPPELWQGGLPPTPEWSSGRWKGAIRIDWLQLGFKGWIWHDTPGGLLIGIGGKPDMPKLKNDKPSEPGVPTLPGKDTHIQFGGQFKIEIQLAPPAFAPDPIRKDKDTPKLPGPTPGSPPPPLMPNGP